MLFKNKKVEESTATSDLDKEAILAGPVPKHVAIILDGNGRWAKKRGKPRMFGHQEGMINVKRMADVASKMGIEALTLYAFSTENWKRAADEVAFLMKLPIRFFDEFAPVMMELNIRMEIIGDKAGLPEELQKAIANIEEMTGKNTGMRLMVALNYGSQDELVGMVRKVATKVQDGLLAVEDINPAIVEGHLYTKDLPPVDLMIRTSGEQRISNFLLWQIAYAELYFTDTAWPDFKEEALYEAVAAFQLRDRRFGGIKS